MKIKDLNKNDRYILEYIHARTGRNKSEILKSGDVEAMRGNFVFEDGGEPNPMDREKFKNEVNKPSSILLDGDDSEMFQAIAKSQDIQTNCVIAMEEMAELQQLLAKYLRGYIDYYGLLEETADVCIALTLLTLNSGDNKRVMSENMLQRAINVKLDRDYKRIRNP